MRECEENLVLVTLVTLVTLLAICRPFRREVLSVRETWASVGACGMVAWFCLSSLSEIIALNPVLSWAPSRIVIAKWRNTSGRLTFADFDIQQDANASAPFTELKWERHLGTRSRKQEHAA